MLDWRVHRIALLQGAGPVDGAATAAAGHIGAQRWELPAYIVMAYVVMAYIIIAYIVMAYVVMACIIIAYIVMAYIVMA